MQAFEEPGVEFHWLALWCLVATPALFIPEHGHFHVLGETRDIRWEVRQSSETMGLGYPGGRNREESIVRRPGKI